MITVDTISVNLYSKFNNNDLHLPNVTESIHHHLNSQLLQIKDTFNQWRSQLTNIGVAIVFQVGVNSEMVANGGFSTAQFQH